MESLLTASGLDANAVSAFQNLPTQSEGSSVASTVPDFAGIPPASLHHNDALAQITPYNSSSASCDATPLESQPESGSWGSCDPNVFCPGWEPSEEVHQHQHQHTWVDTASNKQDLPQPHEAFLLLQEYLEDWNKAIPLFERIALTQIFQDCYAGRELDDSNAWLAIAAVLGLAHRLRGMSPVASPNDDTRAEEYKRQLLNAIPRLLLEDPTLLSVQCIIALGILLYLSADHHRAPFFISIALKMMETLGLGCKRRPVGTIVEDQWSSVFWIAFSMDTDMSIRYGRLPSRRIADLALLDLPSSPTAEGIGEIRSSNGDWVIPFFRMQAELSTIQARVCEELLATSAQFQSIDEKLERLKHDLAKWRSHWIFKMRVDQLMQEIHRSDIILLTNMEASYHITLFAIHTQASLQHRRTAGLFDGDTLLKVGQEKSQPCLADTRRFVSFVRVLPRRDMAAIYMIAHAMVASIAVLMGHAVSNPEEVTAPADLRISRAMLDIMIYLSGKCRTTECRLTRQVCQHLYQQAASVIGKK